MADEVDNVWRKTHKPGCSPTLKQPTTPGGHNLGASVQTPNQVELLAPTIIGWAGLQAPLIELDDKHHTDRACPISSQPTQ